MAIDPTWVRQNPEEAARQMEILLKDREIRRAAEITQIRLRQRADDQLNDLRQKLHAWREWLNEVLDE